MWSRTAARSAWRWKETCRSPRGSSRAISKNDLALLTTSGLTPSAVPNLRTGVRLGENIFVYGFPLSGLLASSGNFTIGNVTAVAGLGDDTTMIQMSAPVQPGNSGGPVLDQHGNVVAVVVSKLNALRIAKVTSDIPQNVNFAIKSLIAMGFLEAGNVNASAAASTAEARDHADRRAGADVHGADPLQLTATPLATSARRAPAPARSLPAASRRRARASR